MRVSSDRSKPSENLHHSFTFFVSLKRGLFFTAETVLGSFNLLESVRSHLRISADSVGRQGKGEADEIANLRRVPSLEVRGQGSAAI